MAKRFALVVSISFGAMLIVTLIIDTELPNSGVCKTGSICIVPISCNVYCDRIIG